ncbi:MAG: hypothetical protein RLZZ399_2341 [Verrucomicrobiota bacterium]|jgi:hypothetical protein
MKKRLLTLLFLSSLALPLWAEPASDASLREFMSVSGASKTMDSLHGMIDGMMDGALPPGFATSLTPEQQASFKSFKQKAAQTVREEMSWAKMEPVFLEIYRGVFSQEEIDGIIAFHKSPVGQAFVSKAPILMSKTMEVMQRKMLPGMMARMQELGAEFQKEISGSK